jgi:DNA adenine methylase
MLKIQSMDTTWIDTPPILRWAGSKRKLLPVLVNSTPSHFRRYVEPFAGSACLFFALAPRHAILGDINIPLLETYKTMRYCPTRIVKRLNEIPNTEAVYYKIRKQVPSNLSAFDRAIRFLYLNRYCFNGVYRTNKNGIFNVPRGTRTGAIPSVAVFKRCAEILQNATFVVGDFTNCISRVRAHDFVYLDPPYDNQKRNTTGEYGPDPFTPLDIPRLLSALRHIDRVGAFFLLSYASNSEFTTKLLSKWNGKHVYARRHVAGFARHRKLVKEILISNYEFRCTS